MKQKHSVPSSLRLWFVVHFLLDSFFAIPLFFIPVQTLTFLGWTSVDPYTARLVAAALFAIGGISFIISNASLLIYRTFLLFKIIWSISAIIGIFITLVQGGLLFGWIVLCLFLLFCSVWISYYKRLL